MGKSTEGNENVNGKYNIYWGDTHANIHERHMDELDKTFEDAKEHLDFLPIAYYPMDFYQTKEGLGVESWHNRPKFLKSWKKIQQTVRDFHVPGELVTFVGYEWHGNRTYYGDHNVFYFDEDNPLDDTDDLPQLFENLKKRRGIAIPHHTAYQLHERGKDWDYHDDDVSPFAEIFSGHGSSEGCWAPFDLNSNASMGPRLSAGSVQEGLAREHRIGIIASNDSHTGKAGTWGQGLIAVCAEELTRERIWEAFMARRVYGVTGDRIKLDFNINEHFMGDEFESGPPLRIHGSAMCSGALDRIELIRNNRVVFTHCHNGTWDFPSGDATCRAKLRFIFGFGPTTRYYSEPRRNWSGNVTIQGGKIISVEGCFSLRDQHVNVDTDDCASWQLYTTQRGGAARGGNMQQIVVEVEAQPKTKLALLSNGQEMTFTLGEAMKQSHILATLEEVQEKIKKRFGLGPKDVENPDIYWHNAYKLKVERAVPRIGYDVPFAFIDEAPPKGRNFYYVRVSQLNGQMAWSSPIWVDVV